MAAKKGFNLLYPLVISIVINLGLIAAVIVQDSTVEEERENALRAGRERKVARNELRKALHKQGLLNELIKGSQDDEVVVEVIRNSHMADWKDLVERIAKERGTPIDREGRGEYTNLLEVYEEMKEELLYQSQQVAQIRTERDSGMNDLAVERASKEDLRRERDSQIKDVQDQLTREQNVHQEDNRKTSSEIQRLIDEKGEAASQKEEMRRSYEIKIAELESIRTDLEQRISALVKKQEQTLATAAPDGEIIRSANDLKLAWINLGRTHGLPRGLPFYVFRIQKGGRRKHKGRIEVLDIEDHLATVSITETVDSTDPIVKGDYIISPLFDKSEQKIFVLLGEMVNLTYSKREVIRKIEEGGGRVDDGVTVQTDYIIAGKDAELLPEFEKALQLGIRVMRETELLDYLAP